MRYPSGQLRQISEATENRIVELEKQLPRARKIAAEERARKFKLAKNKKK